MATKTSRQRKTTYQSPNGKKPVAPTLEIGATGLSAFSGQIREDFLKELRGKEAIKRYNEMRLNSPIIGALLTAIEQSIRGIEWQYTSDLGENDPRLALLEESEANLRHSWNDHVIEALTFLWAGYMLFEFVYERVGGRLLWRKFAPRPPDTVLRWLLDEEGGLQGVVQMTTTGKTAEIPIEKLLLYRTRVEKNNPEGRSILRTSWIPYFFTKHIQQIEGIGIERDLAGLPVIELPEGADTTETDADTSDWGRASRVVRNIRNDEQAGVVLPPRWKLTLLSTGGSRQFDTDKIVTRYEQRMLMSALAQFLMLGQQNVGSLALSRDQSDFFTMSVNATADVLSETFSKFAIPRLMRLNGLAEDGLALEHSPAGDVDLQRIGQFLQQAGGFLTWTEQDEIWLRQAAKMPEIEPERLAEERELERERKAQVPPASPFQPGRILAPAEEEQEAASMGWLQKARGDFDSALAQFRGALQSRPESGIPDWRDVFQALAGVLLQREPVTLPAPQPSMTFNLQLPESLQAQIVQPPATNVIDTAPLAEALALTMTTQRAEMTAFSQALAEKFQLQEGEITALARAISELAQRPTQVNVAPAVTNVTVPQPAVNVTNVLPKVKSEESVVHRGAGNLIAGQTTKYEYEK